MAGDLKHFVTEQNRSALRLQFNIDSIAKKYANRGDAEYDSVLDISSGKILKDRSGKFDGLKPFGSTKLAFTKKHDKKLTEKQIEKDYPEYANHFELNSSGNTNLSIQSFLTHRDDIQEEDGNVSVPKDVRDCVASFLEEPTEQEPSDAETISSHSTDSDSDSNLAHEENAAGNWYTEEEFTASSLGDTGSEDNDDDNDVDDITADNKHLSQMNSPTKYHSGIVVEAYDEPDGTFTVSSETRQQSQRIDKTRKLHYYDHLNPKTTQRSRTSLKTTNENIDADRCKLDVLRTSQSCTRLLSPDKQRNAPTFRSRSNISMQGQLKLGLSDCTYTTQNNGKEFYSRTNQFDKDKRPERIYANLNHIRKDENQQKLDREYENLDMYRNIKSQDRTEKTSPKVSVETQTLKSCTRDKCSEHRFPESTTRTQNSKSQEKMSPGHRDKHGKISSLTHPQIHCHSRETIDNFRAPARERDLISPSKYRTQNRLYCPQSLSPDLHKRTKEKTNIRDTELSSPDNETIVQKTSAENFPSPKPNYRRREIRQSSAYQQSPNKTACKGGGQIIVPNKHSETQDIQCVGQAKSVYSERRYVERKKSQLVRLHLDTETSFQSPSRYDINDEEKGMNRKYTSSSWQIQSNESSTKIGKTPVKRFESKVVEEKENPKSRNHATVINLQLMSPIQDRYKMKHKRSETLTAENIDLLNQSFNDSFVNVSHNKSAINDSQINDNKQKVTEWLDNLDRTEDSLHKASFTEVDGLAVETAFEQIETSDARDHHENQKYKQDCKSRVLAETKRDTWAESFSKPPSKKFKTGATGTTLNDIHKPSAGFIAKSSPHAVHQRFKGMTKRELKALLTSAESGLSSLITIKANISPDTIEQSFVPLSPRITGTTIRRESRTHSDELYTKAGKVTHELSVEHIDLNPEGRSSRDYVRNLSPKSSKRDRSARKTPYSIVRSDKQNSSPHIVRHDGQETETLTNCSRDVYQKDGRASSREVNDSFNELASPVREYREQVIKSPNILRGNNLSCYDRIQEHSKRENFIKRNDRYASSTTINRHQQFGQKLDQPRPRPAKQSSDKSTDTSSLYKQHSDSHQRRHSKHKSSIHKEKFIDSASLNEYCEEGGQESCSCDDIQDRHMDLYQSFESASEIGYVSPDASFQSYLKSPDSHSKTRTPSNIRPANADYKKNSPYLGSRQRTCFEDNVIRQDSPCTSMSKLKINTPGSRGNHLERSHLASSCESRNDRTEMHKNSSRRNGKSSQSDINDGFKEHRRDLQQYELEGIGLERGTLSDRDTSTKEVEVCRLSNETFTVEPAEYEKENRQIMRSNYQRSKSKKNLFSNVGKNSIETNIACGNRPENKISKTRESVEADSCFKLPVSPSLSLKKKQVDSPQIQKSSDEKYILPRNSKNQDNFNNRNAYDRMSRASLEPQRFKVSEIKKTDSVSKQPLSGRYPRASLGRFEKQYVNQLDYAQSTPIRPGIRLSLNETFSTIAGSEETEMEQDEVMLID